MKRRKKGVDYRMQAIRDSSALQTSCWLFNQAVDTCKNDDNYHNREGNNKEHTIIVKTNEEQTEFSGMAEVFFLVPQISVDRREAPVNDEQAVNPT